jgi:Transglutaminase-like superfamily
MMSWHGRLRARTLAAVRAAEALFFLEAASRLVSLWPRRAGGILVQTLSADASQAPDTRFQPELSSAVVHAVERAERYVPRSNCLARAAASCAMLRRRGVRARMRVGARRDSKGGLRAHAWVECDAMQNGPASSAIYAVFSRVA